MSRFTNEVADVPPEGGMLYRCGASDCDEPVNAVVGERHVRHSVYDGDSVTKTVYCSNRCLFASLPFSGGTDD